MGRPREFDEHQVPGRALRRSWHGGHEATSLADHGVHGLLKGSLYGAFGDSAGSS
jgi:hypothetical protein